MPDGTPPQPPTASGGRLAGWSLGLAAAAALASWNPFAAPLGLLVGLSAAALAVAALRRPAARRALAVPALVLGVGAVVASGAVLLLTAGAVTTELPGEPVVRGRSDAEAAALLDRAAKETEVSRRRARRELELETGRAGAAAGAAGTAKDGAGLPPADAGARTGGADETE